MTEIKLRGSHLFPSIKFSLLLYHWGKNKTKQKKQAGLLRNIYVSQLCNVTIIRIIITEKCHQPKDRH